MKLYNVELFSPAFVFRGAAQIGEISLDDDYLDVTVNYIVIRDVATQKGDYIHITSMFSDEVIDGVVTSVDETETGAKVGFKSLLNLLAVKVKRGTVNESDLEQWVVDKVTESYINNTDTYQNLTGMSASKTTTTAGVLPEGDILELYEVICYLLQKYRIVVSVALSLGATNTIEVTVTKNTTSSKTIEADLPNVKTPTVQFFGNGTNEINKAVISSDGEEADEIYYRTTEDVITKTPGTDRITPVVWTIQTLSGGEDFTTKAQEKAEEILKLSAFDNLIEIPVQQDDDLVKPNTIKIGDEVTVLYKDKTYKSVLTAKKYKDTMVTLIFGSIRLELTKIIKRRLKDA